jgi:hypothetical protein
MAELDALGRTPEQAAKERAEIAQEVRRTNYQADREARAIEKARWIVASEDELWVRQAAEDAIRDGYDPEEARRYTRERLATTREERVHRAFADIIVDEP